MKPLFTRGVAAGAALFGALPATATDTTPHHITGTMVDRQSAAVVGLYFSMPLGARSHRPGDLPYQYGVRMQLEDNYWSASGDRSTRLGFQADALALKFGPNGFDNFAISGRDVIEYSTITMRADGTEEKSGGKVNWALVGVGAGALLAVGIVATANNIEDTGRAVGGAIGCVLTNTCDD